jgi:hypothetical protein
MRCLRILQTYTEGVDRRLRAQGYTGLRSHGQAKQQHTISPAATPTSAAAAAVTAANTVANSRTGKIKRVTPVAVTAAAVDTEPDSTANNSAASSRYSVCRR